MIGGASQLQQFAVVVHNFRGNGSGSDKNHARLASLPLLEGLEYARQVAVLLLDEFLG